VTEDEEVSVTLDAAHWIAERIRDHALQQEWFGPGLGAGDS
jgi:hypothetical protein